LVPCFEFSVSHFDNISGELRAYPIVTPLENAKMNMAMFFFVCDLEYRLSAVAKTGVQAFNNIPI